MTTKGRGLIGHDAGEWVGALTVKYYKGDCRAALQVAIACLRRAMKRVVAAPQLQPFGKEGIVKPADVVAVARPPDKSKFIKGQPPKARSLLVAVVTAGGDADAPRTLREVSDTYRAYMSVLQVSSADNLDVVQVLVDNLLNAGLMQKVKGRRDDPRYIVACTAADLLHLGAGLEIIHQPHVEAAAGRLRKRKIGDLSVM